MLQDIKAAIFDLDGTLVDSMWVWEKIDIDYLQLKGHEIPEGIRDDIAHLSFEETAIYFKNRFNIEESIEEIMETWHNMALDEYRTSVKLKAGAREFLALLKAKNIKIGLATSNSSTLLEIALKNNGIYEFFDVITTTNEVSRGKDFPDVYLLTAERLKVDPHQCIVFEDILPAVLGAKAAGMKVVGVFDKAAQHQWSEILSIADKTIKDYNELDLAV
ncbi:HAD family hydrolase [Clostridium thermarum]|uniref:HAD family hydrolase n=1 Tax=Clostridium thermarum TaxID=1716543 RepID=UPI0013D56296|nr:HAD family phosphatase [Clostridium thermarum]